MKRFLILLLIVLSNTCFAQKLELLGTANIRVRVVLSGEDGTVLQRTSCGVGFVLPGNEWATYKFVSKKGITDEKGEFLAEGRTTNSLGVGADPKGYYMSTRSIYLNDEKNGKWMPFPRFETLVMKRVIKPVPMYAVAKWPVVLPAKDAPFGFDLEKRDWVAPHGAGVKADLVFTLEKKEDNVLGNSATLRVSFSNPSDGLIPLYELPGAESELKLPRTAPAEGYEAERKFTTNWSATRLPAPPARPALGYLYRVRTVLDEKGQVKNALYGKIDGEFEWDASNFPTAQVTFTYYLNSDGTPNLEFDRKKNLFLKLADEHTVRRP